MNKKYNRNKCKRKYAKTRKNQMQLKKFNINGIIKLKYTQLE